nr:MAG TPA: hypothetical protein [Bacteriophage sp.]DAX99870.1 MAG TPA: hypothetical protein [Caudoviricetes sp.]
MFSYCIPFHCLYPSFHISLFYHPFKTLGFTWVSEGYLMW